VQGESQGAFDPSLLVAFAFVVFSILSFFGLIEMVVLT
jgi:hypothetical protein